MRSTAAGGVGVSVIVRVIVGQRVRVAVAVRVGVRVAVGEGPGVIVSVAEGRGVRVAARVSSGGDSGERSISTGDSVGLAARVAVEVAGGCASSSSDAVISTLAVSVGADATNIGMRPSPWQAVIIKARQAQASQAITGVRNWGKPPRRGLLVMKPR
jgi:hypothetical protein